MKFKPEQRKAIVNDCIARGWVKHGNKLLTPKQAAEQNITNEKKTKKKRGERKRWSDKTDTFCMLVKQQTGYDVVMEYEFHPVRKWRFDYCIIELMIAIEQEGGVFGYRRKDGTRSEKGAHSSVVGMMNDMEKYNAANEMGFSLIRRTPDALVTHDTIQLLKSLISLKIKSLTCTPTHDTDS